MRQTTSMMGADGTVYDIPDDEMEAFKADFGDSARPVQNFRADGTDYTIPDDEAEAFKADFPNAERTRRISFADGSSKDMTVGEMAEFLRSDEYRNGERYAADREAARADTENKARVANAGNEIDSPFMAGLKETGRRMFTAEGIREGAEESAIAKPYAYANDLANSLVNGLLGGSAKITEGVGTITGIDAVRDAGRADQQMLERNLPTDMLDTSGGGVVNKVLQTGKGVASVTGEFAPAAIPGVGQAYAASLVGAGAANRADAVYDEAVANGASVAEATSLAMGAGAVDALGNMLLMGKFKGIWGGAQKGAADAVKQGVVRKLLGETARTGAIMGGQAGAGNAIDQMARAQDFSAGEMAEAALDGFIEGGMFHLVNTGMHAAVRPDWQTKPKGMPDGMARDVLDTTEGRALVASNSPEAAKRMIEVREKGGDVSRKMLRDMGVPDSVAPTVADRNALGDSIAADFKAYREAVTQIKRTKLDGQQYMALSDEIAGRLGTDQSEDYGKVVIDVLGKIKDAKELDDPYRRDELVGKAVERLYADENAMADADAAAKRAESEARKEDAAAAFGSKEFEEQTRAREEREAQNLAEERVEGVSGADGEVVEKAGEESAQNKYTPEEAAALKKKGKAVPEDQILKPEEVEANKETREEKPDETGNGAAEEPAKPEQGVERPEGKPEATRPVAGAEKGGKAPDEGVVGEGEKPKTEPKAEEVRDSMRGDPVLQRIDAEFKRAKTDAERNALKEQFAARVAELRKHGKKVPKGVEPTADEAAEVKAADVRDPAERNWDAPISDAKDAKALLDSIGHSNLGFGGLSKVMTDKDGRKFVKYRANGAVTPNIYLGETTPREIAETLLLYGNGADLKLPDSIVGKFEKGRADARGARMELDNQEIASIKDWLKKEGIAFSDVIDSERGYRIAYTDRRSEGGWPMDYIDVKDLSDARERADELRSLVSKSRPKAPRKPTAEVPEAAKPEDAKKTGDTAKPAEGSAIAPRRLYTKDGVTFKTPIVGKTGAKVTGYVWPNKGLEYTDKNGNDRVKRISDWDFGEMSEDTGRQIIHQFTVEMQDGSLRTVSAESAAKLLGISTGEVKGDALKQIRYATAIASMPEAQRSAFERKSKAIGFLKPDDSVALMKNGNLRILGWRGKEDGVTDRWHWQVTTITPDGKIKTNRLATEPKDKGFKLDGADILAQSETESPAQKAEKPAPNGPKRNPADNFKGYTYDDYGAPPNTDEATAKTNPGGTGDVQGAALLSHRKESKRLFYIPESKDDPLWDWYQKFNDGNARKNRRGDFIALFGMNPKKGRNDAFGDDLPPELWSLRDKGAEAVAEAMLKARKDYAEWVAKKRNAQRQTKANKAEDDSAFKAEAEERAKAGDLSLESLTPEQMEAEKAKFAEQQKAADEKAELERRKNAPLKGGTGDLGQGKLDLGGAEGDRDLFNVDLESAVDSDGKPLLSKNMDSPLKPEANGAKAGSKKAQEGKNAKFGWEMGDEAKGERAEAKEAPKSPEQEIEERLDLKRLDPKRRSDPKVLEWAKKTGRRVENGMVLPDAVREYDEHVTRETAKLAKRWFPDMNIVQHKFGEHIKRGQHVIDMRDRAGNTLGWFDPKSKEVHLLPGADAETVGHEILWHGTRDYATKRAAQGDTRAQKLLDMMHDVENNVPPAMRTQILHAYRKTPGLTRDMLLNEFGAWFTQKKFGAALEEALKTKEGQNWFAKGFTAMKEMYKDYLTAHGKNRIDLDKIDGMSRDQFIDFMAEQFAGGKTLGNIKGDNLLSTEETKWQARRRKYYDNNAPVRDLERDVEKKTGRKISADDSVEAANALKHGLKEAANIEIQGKLKNFKQTLHEAGLHIEDFEYYAQLRAAAGRDAKIDKRNLAEIERKMKAKGASQDEIDAAKAAYRSTNGSHVSPEEARKLLAEINASPDKAKFEALWDEMQSIIKETLDTQVEAGLVSKEAAEAWRKEEPEYIPFKNEYDAESGDWGGRGSARDFTRPEVYTAKGRQSAAGDIVAHVFMDHQAAKHRAIENAVRQKLAKLVRANPEIGKVEAVDADAWKGLEKDDPNVVTFKAGGQSYVIRLNGTRGAAIANAFTQRNLLKMGWADKGFSVFGKKISFRTFSQVSSGLATRYSPTFFVRNFTKDNIELANIIYSERGPIEGTKWIASYVKSQATMAKTLAKYVATGKIDATPDGDILKRYIKAGGLIAGGVQAEGMASLKEQLTPESILKDAKHGKSKAYAAGKFVLDSIGKLNEFGELATRLNAFATEVRSGKSDAEAALFSRRATVDFNRHGDYTPAFNMIRLFSNSSLGATARAAVALGKSKYGKAAAASLFTLGLSQALIEHFANQDEDERRKKTGEATGKDVSEFERETALFYFRKGDRVYKVAQHSSPFSLINYAGNCVGRWLCGDLKGEDMAKNLGLTAAEMAYMFLPMGSINARSRKGDLVSDAKAAIVSGVVPSSLQPLFEMAFDMDYKGDAVFRHMMNSQDPKSHNGKNSAPEWAKDAAEWMNDATGGNAGKPGKIDLAPEAIQKLVEGFGKNLGKDISMAVNIGEALIKGEFGKIGPRETPVKRDFVKQIDGNDRRFNDSLSTYNSDMNEWRKMRDEWTKEQRAEYKKAHPWVISDRAKELKKKINELHKRENGMTNRSGKWKKAETPPTDEQIEQWRTRRRKLQAEFLTKLGGE